LEIRNVLGVCALRAHDKNNVKLGKPSHIIARGTKDINSSFYFPSQRKIFSQSEKKFFLVREKKLAKGHEIKG
jgi:hypothetical protein